MTDSASSFMAILFGFAVFAVIVAVGWRSVQNRRILRLQGADGQETLIIAGQDDEISSVITTTETINAAPAPGPLVIVNTGDVEATSTPESKIDAEASAAGCDRLSRVVSSTK
jgi:hypothetical protein